MSTVAQPPKKTNRIGLEVLNYKGGKTTLCAGCGHNAISERIVEVFFEMGIQPCSVAKFSGIGCSSKSPAWPRPPMSFPRRRCPSRPTTA